MKTTIYYHDDPPAFARRVDVPNGLTVRDVVERCRVEWGIPADEILKLTVQTSNRSYLIVRGDEVLNGGKFILIRLGRADGSSTNNQAEATHGKEAGKV